MGRFKILPITLVLLAALATTAFGLEIRLKPEAKVRGAMVTLGDIAVIRPSSSAARILADQKLMRSPDPGKRTVLDVATVRSYVTQIPSGLGRCRWTGAKQVKVERVGVTIGPDDIRGYLNAFIREKQAFLPQAEISFKNINLPMPFVLPEGKIDVEVIPSDPRILHSSRFTLIFRVNGQVEKNIAVGGELEAIAPVVVATNDLNRGDIVDPHDVNLVKLDLVNLRDPCLDLKQVLGKKILRPVRQGMPIARNQLVSPPIVRRGQMVTIIAQKGPLRVTAQGISRQNGARGDMVRVQNTSSHKEILCQVSSPGEVKVEF
jgi:flagella basal body P-ring formation protein FlgA